MRKCLWKKNGEADNIVLERLDQVEDCHLDSTGIRAVDGFQHGTDTSQPYDGTAYENGAGGRNAAVNLR